jgi:formylglycine-generating enzyme required for sulfatase activity
MQVLARDLPWIAFTEGLFEIGHAGDDFAFDNETRRHRVWLDAFEIASHPVSHGDFIELIGGGYRRPELWLSTGWDAVTTRTGHFVENGALHPLALRDAAADGMLAPAFGDVWEWTIRDYGRYPSFKPAVGAVGEYNGKFMCGQYVLRGGSRLTPANHVRARYRPHPRRAGSSPVCALGATPADGQLLLSPLLFSLGSSTPAHRPPA